MPPDQLLATGANLLRCVRLYGENIMDDPAAVLAAPPDYVAQ
jgi:hypothetical protein